MTKAKSAHIDWQEVRDAYEEGNSFSELSRRFGLADASIRRCLKREFPDFKPRKRGKQPFVRSGLCATEDCEREVKTRGLCGGCYNKQWLAARADGARPAKKPAKKPATSKTAVVVHQTRTVSRPPKISMHDTPQEAIAKDAAWGRHIRRTGMLKVSA